MSKKPVMGHNPLGYRPLADAKFDFIPQTDGGSGKEEPPFEPAPPSKKVVSYYLEEDLVKLIKKKAKENKESYSHFVSEILRDAIKD